MKKKPLLFLGTAFVISLILSLMFSYGVGEIWNFGLSDSLFAEKKASENIKIIAIDDKSLQEIGRWPWQRDKFAQILEKIDAKVIGIDVGFFESSNEDLILEKALKDNMVLAVEVIYPSGDLLMPSVKHDNLGIVNVFTDEDGVTRLVPVRLGRYDGFAYRIANEYMDGFSYDEDKLRVNYIGGAGKFETKSFSDVLRDGLKSEIVLIGATSVDLHDNYLVPASSGVNMPGVEVHANAIQTFLTRNYLGEQSDFLVMLSIFLACFAGALVLLFFSVFWSAIIMLGMILLYYAYSFFMFDNGIIVNMIYPVLGVVLVYVLGVVLYYLIEKYNRKKVENVFGKYVSKNVMNHVLKIPELHGIDREVSVLFADIRGFTKMSEKMKPKEVVNMLNTYLGELARVVMKHDGTLDKYMGDCVMVFFNAPIEQQDHLIRAVQCGLEMQEVIGKIGETCQHKVGVGIGINSGEVVVGNMGSRERMEYTVIGDTVNLASRLCGLAEAGKVLVTEEVYLKIKDKAKARKLGRFKMKGKEKEVMVYDVLKVVN